jgi:hypothetical protein
MEAHREGWAKMPVAIAGAPLAWRVRGSASFGKIFETLRTLVLRLHHSTQSALTAPGL